MDSAKPSEGLRSKGAVDRLGERLRREGAVSSEDWRLLNEYRDRHVPALFGVVETICRNGLGVEVHVSARQKNAYTIVDKLRRESRMQLSNMYDIAGARVVVSGGRWWQDEVVRVLEALFPEHKKVKDRRAEPIAGYRAVHLVVKVSGVWVEIQIRTVYQDKWAQIYERLGDHWGRQIRYGQEPDEPFSLVGVQGEGIVSRSEVIEYVRDTSEQLHDIETIEFDVTSQANTPGLGRDIEREYQLRQDFEHIDALFEALREVAPAASGSDLIRARVNPQMEGLQYFLVTYQRSRGLLLGYRAFERNASSQRLFEARAEMEAKYGGDSDVEIVLLASESIEDLRRTHARYFQGVEGLSRKN